MIESKSLKLYLNSLNNHRFASQEQAKAVITRDLGAVAGAGVSLELVAPGDGSLAGANLSGDCLDDLPVAIPAGEPVADMLQLEEGPVARQRCYSHLLRSLCPVTGQPDWATVWFEYEGRPIVQETLLAYILAYRQHQEYHEHCVERMFRDIVAQCRPAALSIQAFYTRRGGLDINPFRSTDPDARPLPRLNRQ
jgi:7-cyano-7-deazaguanine reductase